MTTSAPVLELRGVAKSYGAVRALRGISLAIHPDIPADRWMLYHHLSTSAGDGMTHAECRVHDEAGRHLASFTVDAMVRGFGDRTAAGDHRTAL